MRNIVKNNKGQAVAPDSIPITKEAFYSDQETRIYWLGGAGIMIHSYQTNVMIDPVLEGFDIPLLYEVPILSQDVPQLDGILITHIDNDHFSRPTCRHVQNVCQKYYAPNYVADVMNEEGFQTEKHDIDDVFQVQDLSVQLTRAQHNWQNGSKKWQYRYWEEKDYCGYWLKTPDGTIWLPGDSRLLDEHLHMPEPDVILFDFADNDWHITLDGAIQLANTYPHAHLICIHWGSVDAPDMTPFNGNPEDLYQRVMNPDRIHVLAPGEAFVLKGEH